MDNLIPKQSGLGLNVDLMPQQVI